MKQLWVAPLIAAASVFSAGLATVTAPPVRALMDDASGPAVAPELSVAAPKGLRDVAIATDASRSERAQAIAANPRNPSLLLLVVGNEEGDCLAYRSANAGRTWSGPVALPDATDCHFPSADAAYTADGRGVYVAFSNRDTEEGGPRILVTRSGDNGATWRSPVVAIAERGSWGYILPRLATPLRESDGNWLYLTAELEVDVGPSDEIVFASSADHGNTWTEAQFLAKGNQDIDPVFGSSVAGGIGGEVLVTLVKNYNDSCTETIQVLRSEDHGATFGPPVVAATHGCFSAALPDVKIGYRGAAHLVYVRNGDREGDAGDIEYIWSPGPPYTTWSEPVTVNDDGLPRTQTGPSLATQTCGTSTILHLVWDDERLSPASSPDRYRDVFYARKLAKMGAGWSKNMRVSDKSSLTFMSPLDAAASRGRVFAAWTDGRDKTDPADSETDVFGSGILSGVSCP